MIIDAVYKITEFSKIIHNQIKILLKNIVFQNNLFNLYT